MGSWSRIPSRDPAPRESGWKCCPSLWPKKHGDSCCLGKYISADPGQFRPFDSTCLQTYPQPNRQKRRRIAQWELLPLNPTTAAVASFDCLATRTVSGALQFEHCTAREAVSADRTAGGKSVWLEVGDVELVEFFPVRHVGKHHGTLENILNAASGGIQRRSDIFHCLARLIGKLRWQPAIGSRADLARQIKNVFDPYRS